MTTLVMHFKRERKQVAIQATWLDVVMPSVSATDIATSEYYGKLTEAFKRDYEEIPDDGHDELDTLLSQAARL
jgi:hypothetical protein